MIFNFIITMADLKQSNVMNKNLLAQNTLVDSQLKVEGTDSAVYKYRARFDNYCIYRVEFSNEEQVDVFKKLEEQSDSMIFIGHANEVGQKLSILVAAHKIPDLLDLINHYKIKHHLLVIGNLGILQIHITHNLFTSSSSSSLFLYIDGELSEAN